MEDEPFFGKISPTVCLGRRVVRPTCCCCGGAIGVRRAWRKFNRHQTFTGHPSKWQSKGRKPKRGFND